MSKKKSEIEVRRETMPTSTEGWPSILSLILEIYRLFDDFGSGVWCQLLSRQMHALLLVGGYWSLRPATEFANSIGSTR